MLLSNAARATQAAAQRSPRKDRLGGTINPGNTTQPIITATFNGDRRCEALGISASGYSPALALCRELLAAGISPDAALDIHRNGVLALRIRTIGEAARLTVEDNENGSPRFRLARPSRRGAVPPMRKNG